MLTLLSYIHPHTHIYSPSMQTGNSYSKKLEIDFIPAILPLAPITAANISHIHKNIYH